MPENAAQRRRFFEFAACLWIITAQIWYYSQFREQFRSILSLTLRKLWH
jgi:hypothetical protein